MQVLAANFGKDRVFQPFKIESSQGRGVLRRDKMKNCLIICFAWIVWGTGQAGEIVEVSGTLVRLRDANVLDLSQIELRQQLLIARNQGAEDQLKFSAVVESGKWATIKRGREFWYPGEYCATKVHQAPGDDGVYSIPKGAIPPGNDTIIIPSSPTRMDHVGLGAVLEVRPTVKEDGLIYLEGRFKDTVFEGLSQEAIPVNVEIKQLVGPAKSAEVMVNRIDRPMFDKVEKEFGVMLPYSAGTSENAKRLRESQSKYTYFVPMVLGNTAFGAPGKIELKTSGETAMGPIKSTMMKATMVKDFFIRPQETNQPVEYGILILEVKKIDLPAASPQSVFREKLIFLNAKFVESESPEPSGKLIWTEEELLAASGPFAQRKGVDLMSAPSITFKPGQSGKIEVVREFIFPAEYLPPGLSTVEQKGFPVDPSIPKRFESRNIGITLELVAAIGEEDRIHLKVKSSVRAFEGFLDFGNPIMALKSGMIKRMKPVVAMENRVEMPIFPFRETETEVVVPSGSYVAVTTIFDYYNKNHQTEGFLKIGKPKVDEVKTPRYLTVYLSPSMVPPGGKLIN